MQATGFNESLDALAAAGYKVYGLSADAPAQQASWKAKHGFKYDLLCDTDASVALKPLGWVKEDGGIIRSHALIAKGGAVVAVERGGCPFQAKVEAVAAAGGGAALILSHEDDHLTMAPAAEGEEG